MKNKSLKSVMPKFSQSALNFPGLLILCLSISLTPLNSWGNPIDSLLPGHWYEVPNSHMRDVAWPENNFSRSYAGGTPAIIDAWSSGAYDSKRDRLIIWGGGHNDYPGNEIYTFDINTLKWERVNDPSFDVGGDEATGVYPDGKPRSRHTYDYIEYIPPPFDRFCTFGGAGMFSGGQKKTPKTHCFNFDTKRWERMADATAFGVGALSAYDLATGHIWVRAGTNGPFAKFDPSTNTWTSHVRERWWLNDKFTAAIDPVRRKFVIVGNGSVRAWDLNHPDQNPEILSTSGSTEIIEARSPGFEYDPVNDVFVAWSGGVNVYTLNMDTLVWTKHLPAPSNIVTPTAANARGTYGRFRYVPSKNVFIVVNSVDENVFVYKFSPGGGAPPDTQAPNPPLGLRVQ